MAMCTQLASTSLLSLSLVAALAACGSPKEGVPPSAPSQVHSLSAAAPPSAPPARAAAPVAKSAAGAATPLPPDAEGLKAVLRAPDALSHVSAHVVDELCLDLDLTKVGNAGPLGLSIHERVIGDTKMRQVVMTDPSPEAFQRFYSLIEKLPKPKNRQVLYFRGESHDTRFPFAWEALCVVQPALLTYDEDFGRIVKTGTSTPSDPSVMAIGFTNEAGSKVRKVSKQTKNLERIAFLSSNDTVVKVIVAGWLFDTNRTVLKLGAL
jgi:hypothetical protein